MCTALLGSKLIAKSKLLLNIFTFCFLLPEAKMLTKIISALLTHHFIRSVAGFYTYIFGSMCRWLLSVQLCKELSEVDDGNYVHLIVSNTL